jgi:hypothetical protein
MVLQEEKGVEGDFICWKRGSYAMRGGSGKMWGSQVDLINTKHFSISTCLFVHLYLHLCAMSTPKAGPECHIWIANVSIAAPDCASGGHACLIPSCPALRSFSAGVFIPFDIPLIFIYLSESTPYVNVHNHLDPSLLQSQELSSIEVTSFPFLVVSSCGPAANYIILLNAARSPLADYGDVL